MLDSHLVEKGEPSGVSCVWGEAHQQINRLRSCFVANESGIKSCFNLFEYCLFLGLNEKYKAVKK